MPEFDTTTTDSTTDYTNDDFEYSFETEDVEGTTTARNDDTVDPAPKASARSKKTLTRNQVAKILTKHNELADVDQILLDVLGTSIGTKATPVDITAVLFSSGRVNLSPVVDVLAIADASSESPYQGILKAMQLDREQAKLIWQVLTAIGAVTGNIPAKDSAASVAIAEAAAELDSEHTRQFDRVRELAKK